MKVARIIKICYNLLQKEVNMESYIAENIMREYRRKKRYEENKAWSEVQNFIKENCKNCKNRNTDLCEIRKNVKNELYCQFKK